MRKTFSLVWILGVLVLTWQAWNPPISSFQAQGIRFSIPNIAPLDSGQWRVVTRRMVWKKAVDGMRNQLDGLGYTLILIHKKEPIELHAFDDIRLFSSKKAAYAAKTWWENKHIDAEVLDTSGSEQPPVYRVELGRYYLSAYAKDAQKELNQAGKPYRYQKRQVMIPSYRFAFSAMVKSEAVILWRRLQNMGIVNPVMMQASKFDTLYKGYLITHETT